MRTDWDDHRYFLAIAREEARDEGLLATYDTLRKGVTVVEPRATIVSRVAVTAVAGSGAAGSALMSRRGKMQRHRR